MLGGDRAAVFPKLKNDWGTFVRNSFAYSCAQLISLVAQFTVVPFFLSHWGTERYAEWIVISSVPGILSISNLGVSEAFASKAVLLSARADVEGIRRCFQTALAFSAAVALLVVGVVAATGLFLDWANIFELTSISESEASVVLLLLTVHLGLNILDGPIQVWFRATNRTATGVLMASTRRLVDVGVIIGVLLCGGGTKHLAVALVASQLVLLPTSAWLAIKGSAWNLLGLESVSLRALREVIRPSIGHIGLNIAQVVTLQGTVQVLNARADPALLVLYTMCRTLVRIIVQGGMIASNALRPVISRLLGATHDVAATAISRRVTLIAAVLAISAYVGLGWLGPVAISYWSHGEVVATHAFVLAVGLHAVLNVLWYVPAAYQFAGNQHSRLALVYLASSVVGMLIGFTWAISNPLAFVSFALAFPELVTLAFLLRVSALKHSHVSRVGAFK